jgi:hypothetical protein
MTTPASPAPGGGVAQPSPTGSQSVRPPADPPNLVAQAAERTADAEPSGKPGLTPDEERKLGELLAKRDESASQAPIRLKVTGDHESMTFGGVTIGREFTAIPPSMVGGITEAAALAGVEITQES